MSSFWLGKAIKAVREERQQRRAYEKKEEKQQSKYMTNVEQSEAPYLNRSIGSYTENQENRVTKLLEPTSKQKEDESNRSVSRRMPRQPHQQHQPEPELEPAPAPLQLPPPPSSVYQHVKKLEKEVKPDDSSKRLRIPLEDRSKTTPRSRKKIDKQPSLPNIQPSTQQQKATPIPKPSLQPAPLSVIAKVEPRAEPSRKPLTARFIEPCVKDSTLTVSTLTASTPTASLAMVSTALSSRTVLFRRHAVLAIAAKEFPDLEKEWVEARDETLVARENCLAFLDPRNSARNRYRDIPCLDATRVCLRSHTSDYIHANFVSTAKYKNRFICTQGPTKNTVSDFWHMVMQEKTKIIIQLCNYEEGGKAKCAQYFPTVTGTTMTMDALTINCLGTSMFDANEKVVQRVLKVTENYGRREEWVLEHLHWSSWPDHGIPRVSDITSRILAKCSLIPSPILIHCSAGVGRTGSVVALQMAIDQVEMGRPVDGFKQILMNLRRQRLMCVQTVDQYLWINRTLVDMWTDSALSNDPKVIRFKKEYDRRFLLPCSQSG